MLYDSTFVEHRMDEVIDTKENRGYQGLPGTGEWGVIVERVLSVQDDEKALEIDSRDSYTTI